MNSFQHVLTLHTDCCIISVSLNIDNTMSDWDEDTYMDDYDEDEELSFEDDDDDDGNEYNNDNIDIDSTKGNSNGDEPNSINIESTYYEAKNLKDENNTDGAIQLFHKIVNCDFVDIYKFKSIKQLIKIFEKKSSIAEVCELVNLLFKFVHDNTNTVISVSKFNSSLTNIIKRIENNSNDLSFNELVLNEIKKCLSQSQDSSSSTNLNIQKLEIKIDIILAKLYYKHNQKLKSYETLNYLESQILNMDEIIKNIYYLDILSLKLLILLSSNQMDSETLTKIKQLSEIANQLLPGIPDYKILGIINEGLGVASIYDMNYEKAYKYFSSAFINFNDFGDDEKFNVLVKYIISLILSNSDVNPFKSSDFQSCYKEENNVILIKFYNSVYDLNIDEFNNYLKDPEFNQIVSKYQILNDFLKQIKDTFYFKYVLDKIPRIQTEEIEFTLFTNSSKIDLVSFKKALIKIFREGYLTDYKIDFINEKIIKKDHQGKFISLKPIDFIDNCFKYFNIQSEDMALSNDIDKEEKEVPNNNLIISMKKMKSKNVNDHISELIFFKSVTKINMNKLSLKLSYNANQLKNLTKLLYEKNIINEPINNDSSIYILLPTLIDDRINCYINGLTKEKTNNLSYSAKIRYEQKRNEYFKSIKANESNDLSIFQNDDNIPNVIQNSLMHMFYIPGPSNPDWDYNDEYLKLSNLLKKNERLKLNKEMMDIITRKHQDMLVYDNVLQSIMDDDSNNEKHSNIIEKNENEHLTAINNFEMEMLQFNKRLIREDTYANEVYGNQSEVTSVDRISVDGEEDE